MVSKSFSKGTLLFAPFTVPVFAVILLLSVSGGRAAAQTKVTASWDPSVCIIYGLEDDVVFEVSDIVGGAEVPILTFKTLTETEADQLDMCLEAVGTVPPSIAVVRDDGIKARIIFYRPQEGTYSERLQITKGTEDWLWYWTVQ